MSSRVISMLIPIGMSSESIPTPTPTPTPRLPQPTTQYHCSTHPPSPLAPSRTHLGGRFSSNKAPSSPSTMCNIMLTYYNPTLSLFDTSFHPSIKSSLFLLLPRYSCQGDLLWRVEYDFDQAYSATSLDASTFVDLLRRLQNDPQLFSEWLARFSVLYSDKRWVLLCTIRYPDRQDFLKCVADEPH